MKTEISNWDASQYLDSPEMIKEYINAAIEEGNPTLLQAALGDIAKAQGMTDVAKKANVSRQNLYKTFAAESHPRLDTIQKVMHSLGLKLKVDTL